MFIAALFGLAVTTAACAESEIRGVSGDSLGLIPIGGVPQDMGVFVSSDCVRQPRFSDCSAQDAEGRRYAFFDGALSKVSISRDEATQALRLPAGLQFGEEIGTASEKISSAFGVELDRGTSSGGKVVYSSDFTIRSSAGILYSIELVADEAGRLTEMAERTDF